MACAWANKCPLIIYYCQQKCGELHASLANRFVHLLKRDLVGQVIFACTSGAAWKGRWWYGLHSTCLKKTKRLWIAPLETVNWNFRELFIPSLDLYEAKILKIVLHVTIYIPPCKDSKNKPTQTQSCGPNCTGRVYTQHACQAPHTLQTILYACMQSSAMQ